MPDPTPRPVRRAAKKAAAKTAKRTAKSAAKRGARVVAALDPVTAYARRVIAGELVVGRLVRLACERHVRDLKDGAQRGLRFDVDAAQHAIDFFGFLRHSKWEWAGTVVTLESWQQFIVGSLFGWMRQEVDAVGAWTKQWVRRFRTAYIEIARKNGKSTLAAGLGLYLFFGDGEPGSEVYCAATKRDQAKIVWDEAKRMVQKSPAIASRVGVFTANLHIPGTASKMEPLGADADSMDGLNPHGVIIDELHAHKTSAVVEVLDTATGSRRQPLQVEITTAGFNRESICYKHRTLVEQILEGAVANDEWFGYVAALDKEDDWRDERVWAKANPNLGVSVKLDALRKKATEAAQMPAAQNAFKRLRLNVWTEQADRWIDMDVWDACAGEGPIDETALEGRRCFGGLDLSSTTDISALALDFPVEGDDPDADPDYLLDADDDEEAAVIAARMRVLHVLVWRFWLPKELGTDREGVRKREIRDRVPYAHWAEQGLLTLTPGNVLDYDVIRRDVNELADRFQIVEIAYDPWNATQLAVQLEGDGLVMVQMRQGFTSMAAPTREFEKLLLGRQLVHGQHPIATWMAANVAVTQDPAGNKKPDKTDRTKRIDGIVAGIMAVGRATLDRDDTSNPYEERGLLGV